MIRSVQTLDWIPMCVYKTSKPFHEKLHGLKVQGHAYIFYFIVYTVQNPTPFLFLFIIFTN